MYMNRIASLFDIEYPVIQGGMVWCSGWRLAAAVSNAGGLGLLGAGSMHPETLREHIRKCRAATDRPFGVNALRLLQFAVLYHRPHHAGGRFGAQGDAFVVAVIEGVHFFADDVGFFADSAFEQAGLFEQRQLQRAVAVAGKDGVDEVVQLLQVAGFGRENVVHPA